MLVGSVTNGPIGEEKNSLRDIVLFETRHRNVLNAVAMQAPPHSRIL